MFIGVQGITKYLLLTAFALFSVCLAAVNKDKNVNYNTTERSNNSEILLKYDDFSYDNDVDTTDRTVFFIVLSFGALFIILLIYFCQKDESDSSSSSSSPPRIPGAVVHPPPRHLNPVTDHSRPIAYPPPTVRPTAPMVSYTNIGFQTDTSTRVDGLPSDAPPDYGTVTIGDLTTQSFPMVKPKLMETPPPKYSDGKPF